MHYSSEWEFILCLTFACFVCSLDPEQKDMLIEVIEKLLADKTTVSVLQRFTLTMV